MIHLCFTIFIIRKNCLHYYNINSINNHSNKKNKNKKNNNHNENDNENEDENKTIAQKLSLIFLIFV